ncbi:hypothetical protein ACIPX0_26200 [Streptomyces sp. NPDC090075]|uniref:hypothetical protein n=1 Tax=Streptomyces sp. NPDC090075 TaxID=3365937 RepID=UPI0037F6E0F1
MNAVVRTPLARNAGLHPVKPPSASEGNAVRTETSTFEVVKAEDGDLPVDVELIQDTTDAALALRLGTTTRKDIDAKTPVLIGHLQVLLSEELRADGDELVIELCRKAYRVLDLAGRPKKEATTFAAFFFMRDVADLARRLLWIHAERNSHAS